jgi:trimethylamine--corrinoid protein Co-methyltransferase
MHSETPSLEPIVPAYRLRVLTDEQLEQLKLGTLEILEEVGIHCPSEKALSIYAEHGAQVDFESQIVRLPPELVLEAMSHAPRFYTMAARSSAHDLKLDGTAMYCATDGPLLLSTGPSSAPRNIRPRHPCTNWTPRSTTPSSTYRRRR